MNNTVVGKRAIPWCFYWNRWRMSNELDRLCRFRVLSPELDLSGKLLSFTSVPFLQTGTSAHMFILQPSGKSPFIKRSVLIFHSFTAIGTSSPLSAAPIWVVRKKAFRILNNTKRKKFSLLSWQMKDLHLKLSCIDFSNHKMREPKKDIL